MQYAYFIHFSFSFDQFIIVYIATLAEPGEACSAAGANCECAQHGATIPIVCAANAGNAVTPFTCQCSDSQSWYSTSLTQCVKCPGDNGATATININGDTMGGTGNDVTYGNGYCYYVVDTGTGNYNTAKSACSGISNTNYFVANSGQLLEVTDTNTLTILQTIIDNDNSNNGRSYWVSLYKLPLVCY